MLRKRSSDRRDGGAFERTYGKTVQAPGQPQVGTVVGEPKPKYVVIGQHGTRDDDLGWAGDPVRLVKRRRVTPSGMAALIFEA